MPNRKEPDREKNRFSARAARYARGGTGTLQTGRFAGKMIVVEALMDEAAYPWQADWYRSQVQQALGDRLGDQFRLWFVDRAMHTGPWPSRNE